MVLALAVVLVVGALAYTLFIRAGDLPRPEPVSPTAHLDERRARIYENLRDLQFEYRVGKLSDDDYQKTKTDLQKELSRVLSEIDRIQPAQAASPVAIVKADGKTCPHCGAKFPRRLKFCGECGKPMAERA